MDDPLTVAVHPEPGRGPQEYSALLGGLHTSPALITHPGRQSGVQVGLDPLAARALPWLAATCTELPCSVPSACTLLASAVLP